MLKLIHFVHRQCSRRHVTRIGINVTIKYYSYNGYVVCVVTTIMVNSELLRKPRAFPMKSVNSLKQKICANVLLMAFSLDAMDTTFAQRLIDSGHRSNTIMGVAHVTNHVVVVVVVLTSVYSTLAWVRRSLHMALRHTSRS